MGALEVYEKQAKYLHEGRTPPVEKDGLKLEDLVNRFLTGKRLLVDSGELALRSWRDYYITVEILLGVLDKTRLVIDLTPDDFDRVKAELAKTNGPVSVGNEINRMRVIFNWAYDQTLIDRPIRFGPSFKRPSKKTVRLERAKKGSRMFEADELRSIIEAIPMPMKAMVMLGINAGLGNTDVSGLSRHHLDLAHGWICFPRSKTGIGRRCPLWPETVELIQQAIAERPAPNQPKDELCVFLTVRGERCVLVHDHKDKAGVKVDAITRDFGKFLRVLKLKRPGLNFYAIRHTFETIAGASRDQVAVDRVMGHADESIADLYRERIENEDERLTDVVNRVKAWLWHPPLVPLVVRSIS
jgi:integrase